MAPPRRPHAHAQVVAAAAVAVFASAWQEGARKLAERAESFHSFYSFSSLVQTL